MSKLTRSVKTPKNPKIQRKLSKRRILVIGIFLVFLIVLGFSINSRRNTITFTKKGFSPETLHVKINTTVTFINKSDDSFWPASDSHPSHLIYPEFDPKRAIEPREKWSFTFIKEGRWRYHDHLSPSFEGMIIVGENFEIPTLQSFSDCSKISPRGKKIGCYEELIYYILDTKGVSAAFETLDQIIREDGDTLSDCHGITHKIGKQSYHLFEEGKKVDVSDKSYYCGYGFYHGFMEEMLHSSGNIDEARKFCDYVQESLKNKTSDAGGACYHGIGHGVVEDIPDKKMWGNAQMIIDRGLNLCDKVANTEDRVYRCGSGVFNAYEILASQKKYNLSHDAVHPFKICDSQKEKYRKSCYQQLVVPVMESIRGDFKKGIQIIDEEIENREYKNRALIALMVEMVHQGQTDFDKAIILCRNTSKEIKSTCIQGYVEGFMKYGPPQNEYKKALEFCASNILSKDEKEVCYKHVLEKLRIWYTVEKSEKICKAVPQKYWYRNCTY